MAIILLKCRIKPGLSSIRLMLKVNQAFAVAPCVTGLSEPVTINLGLDLLTWTMSLTW